ncbi:hypothetical protein QJS04_geneDACA011014 [Acorus gramineus]|uniref:Uncharacterized protein n=1 Tax=Acorus gramineus TaxID=55184 RepID=A0AAV9BJK5_ACOGR|nr:hypothetical protein QJS04_geneDACA011014 [Acorus gramineus]
MKEGEDKSNSILSVFSMDFTTKGLSWAENLFENMNLEVLGLDSIREQVSKAYDEIVNDLLNTSTVDKPVTDLSLKNKSLDDVSMKSKLAIARDILKKVIPEELEKSMPIKYDLIPASSPGVSKDEKLEKSCNIYDKGSIPTVAAVSQPGSPNLLANVVSHDVCHSRACDVCQKESICTPVRGILHDGKCTKHENGGDLADSLSEMLDMMNAILSSGDDPSSMSINQEIEESEPTSSGHGISAGVCVSSKSREHFDQMGTSGNDHCQDGETTTPPEIVSSKSRQMGSSGNDHWQDGEPNALPETETAKDDYLGSEPLLHPEDHDLVDPNTEQFLEEFEAVKIVEYEPGAEDGKSKSTIHINKKSSYKKKIKDAFKMGFRTKRQVVKVMNQDNNVDVEATASTWVHCEPNNLLKSSFFEESEWEVL